MPQSFADQLRSIPMSPNLGESLERAHRGARDQSHRLVTLEHLLLALTEDAEAALILQSANVDLARLGTDVSGYLGRLMEDMRAEPGAEPRPDAELLRVLQAAASAAQQSRRKQIDGAIVLAAIVGDGKSPAAGLLKALGMTFEEAIRALQRANTKARLKPLAKASAAAAVPPAESSTMPADAEPVSASPQAAHSSDLPITEPASPIPEHLATQSPDEILAAARARIQKRSAAAARTEPVLHDAAPAPPLEPTYPASLEMDTDPLLEPIDPVQAKSLTAAIEAAMASPHSRGAEPRLQAVGSSATVDPYEQAQPTPVAPPQPAAARPARAAWTPTPEPRPQPPARLPQPALARAPAPPFPARPLQPHEGPRRPPLPPRAAPHGQPPQPGFPNRPARAPWPEPGERDAGTRPPLANGSYPQSPPPPQQAPERPDRAARPPQAPRGVALGEKGLLIEAVPRRMRAGVPATAEVRIARDKVDGLLAALNGRDPSPSANAFLTRALSVRLRATKGGFWIEPVTPETQWVESGSGRVEDDYIAWRWTVVPRRRGRSRLTLMVAAHTTGRDGIAAKSSPPDRVIDVKIRANHLRRALRLMGWIAAAIAGAALAQYWPLAFFMIRKTLGI
jgi:neural Wiskott-Aldrich syndrome protein